MGFFAFVKRCWHVSESEKENKELKEQNENLKRAVEIVFDHEAYWKERAERAEQFWGERQKEITDLAQELQDEKLKSGRIEAQITKKMMRLAQFAAVRMLKKWKIAVSVRLHKKDGDFSLEQLSVILRPSFIVDVICELLGTTKEKFLANLDFSWDEKLRQLLAEDRVLKVDDDFSDIGGKLSLKSCCQMGKCGTDECEEKKGCGTK